jgi:hypothetical protein
MPSIYEIFGYRINDTSEAALYHRLNAHCPFMDNLCDGGGNRYSTQISLEGNDHEELRSIYSSLQKLMPGVCSIKLEKQQTPWIVCPRRLLNFRASHSQLLKNAVEKNILNLLNFPTGTKLGVWRETKIEYYPTDSSLGFDYAFDYVLVPVNNIKVSQILTDILNVRTVTPTSIQRFIKSLVKSNFVIEDDVVLDFPVGSPIIIEIMTSSTSGSNKNKRSQISQAFEDALLGKPHLAPGINYRQIWSRMVGQLFVKSEVAVNWGGKAIWVLQDHLVDYIDKTTRLNIQEFRSEELSDINILSVGYNLENDSNPMDLTNIELFSGKLDLNKVSSDFTDIIRIATQPPFSRFIEQLVAKGAPKTFMIVE